MTIALGADPGPGTRSQPHAPTTPTTRLIGVEEELLLVDADTFRPRPAANEILQVAPPFLPAGSLIEAEAKLEQIEVVSPPLGGYAELLDAIVDGRQATDSIAQSVGARAVALATPVDACSPHLVKAPRYERMQERFGLTMDEQLTCGFHVHVTVASPQEGVAVLDRIRPWLPLLLALSANSPYWNGVDTEFARRPSRSAYPTSASTHRTRHASRC